jgi:YegS/Rv2252/BmrU family lipid kinase
LRRPTVVILNPWGGRGRAARSRDLVARALRDTGTGFDLVETDRRGHANGLAAEAVAGGATRILVAGGDGTIHEVANALLDLPPAVDGGTPAALGCIPLGTGNDFAKLVGVYGLPPEAAAARMVHGQEDLFDAGRVLGEWFDNIFGVGFDAETVRHAEGIRRLKGVLVYLAAIYRTFLTFRAPVLEVSSAEHSETSSMMMMAANIGVSGGGRFFLTPGADPRDGMLDVCVIRKVSTATFLTAVPRVMRGTHGALPEVTMFRTKRLTVRSADGRPLVLQLDGELREPGVTEVEVTIAARRLRVLKAT